MKKIILIFIVIAFQFSCKKNSNPIKTDIHEETTSDSIETNNSPTIFDIKEKRVYLLDTPTNIGKKIINVKATEALGSTEYLSVGRECKVIILEEKENWVKIKVIDPYWLSDSHIGWIDKKNIRFENYDDNYTLNEKDFEILKKVDNASVTNYYVYYKSKNKTEEVITMFSKAFSKKVCTSKCNIYVIDSKSIINLIDKYPLRGEEYIKVADHFIFLKDFDSEYGSWYPYQDILYKEYGGKNWKKDPIK